MSIVGTERIPTRYFKLKQKAEQTVFNSGVPFTILRATQFFPFFEDEIRKYLRLPIAFLPKKILYQPIEVIHVANRLLEIASGDPKNGIIEIGGSQKIELGEATKILLNFMNESKVCIDIPLFLLGKLGKELENGALTTHEVCFTSATWANWLDKKEAHSKC